MVITLIHKSKAGHPGGAYMSVEPRCLQFLSLDLQEKTPYVYAYTISEPPPIDWQIIAF